MVSVANVCRMWFPIYDCPPEIRHCPIGKADNLMKLYHADWLFVTVHTAKGINRSTKNNVCTYGVPTVTLCWGYADTGQTSANDTILSFDDNRRTESDAWLMMFFRCTIWFVTTRPTCFNAKIDLAKPSQRLLSNNIHHQYTTNKKPAPYGASPLNDLCWETALFRTTNSRGFDKHLSLPLSSPYRQAVTAE